MKLEQNDCRTYHKDRCGSVPKVQFFTTFLASAKYTSILLFHRTTECVEWSAVLLLDEADVFSATLPSQHPPQCPHLCFFMRIRVLPRDYVPHDRLGQLD